MFRIWSRISYVYLLLYVVGLFTFEGDRLARHDIRTHNFHRNTRVPFDCCSSFDAAGLTKANRSFISVSEQFQFGRVVSSLFFPQQCLLRFGPTPCHKSQFQFLCSKTKYPNTVQNIYRHRYIVKRRTDSAMFPGAKCLFIFIFIFFIFYFFAPLLQ